MYNPKDDEQKKVLMPEIVGVNVPEQSAQPDQYQQSINRMALNNAGAELAMQRNINQQAQELQRAEQEQRDASRLEAQKPIWGAATEFAGALFNLWGTAKGANNQQQHIYSQDWMTRADANRRERKQRIDNIRERQRAAELQLAQLKAGNANALEQMRMDNQLRQENRALQQRQIAQSDAELSLRAQNQAFNQELALKNIELEKENQELKKYQIDSEERINAGKFNLVKDGKGGYITQTTEGGNTNKNLEPFLMPSIDGKPAESLMVDYDAIAENLKYRSNEIINELPDNYPGKDLLQNMQNLGNLKDDQIKALLPYSKTLQDIVRASGTITSNTPAYLQDPTGGLQSLFGN